MSTTNNQIKKSEATITDQVLTRINQMQAAGSLVLPPNYEAANALNQAYLILLETKNKENQFALQHCTKESISFALLDMVTQGLNPAKRQCYFIMYGQKLQMMRSYMGTIAVAKRAANVKDVFANVIYEKDVFKYKIDFKTGKKEIEAHEQEFDNIDDNKVKGAYAVVIYNDDSVYTEMMTIAQIRAAWEQSKMGVGKVHNKFTGEMAKKTVISRALKIAINSSNDESLYEEITEPAIDVVAEDIKHEIVEKANKDEIGFDQEDLKEPDQIQGNEPEKEPEPVTESEPEDEPPFK